MRFQSYFNTALKIIGSYDGLVPLQHFLKQYYSQHKKHGSRDRKFITHACYNFYRLGKSFGDIKADEKLKIAIFICNDDITAWDFLYDEEWLNSHTLLQQRIDFIRSKYSAFSLNDVFPFANEVSTGVDLTSFALSFFIQPDVFIRIRPGYTETVINKLQQHTAGYNYIDENCIALPASINISSIISIDEEAVVQDYSSQKVKGFLETVQSALSREPSGLSNPKSEIVNPKSVWDCCAASGGKSILAYDTLDKPGLTVSDVRASIIQNLKQRFAKAGIKNYKSFVADITNSKFQIPNSTYDLIICDAPCTGSGTWSRTPEQLFFFHPAKIDHYNLLQRKIVSNAITVLKDDGFFLYITCSVFEKENEAVVDFIQQQFHLQLTVMELLKGYDKKADTMFAALFRKTRPVQVVSEMPAQ